MHPPRRVLFLQTAFIGDTILATSLVESWHMAFPDDSIDFCTRRGNEDLFANHPFLNEVLVWNKSGNFWARSWKLLLLARLIRNRKYDIVVTPHRHVSSGVLLGFSKARHKCGFANHPMAWRWTHRVEHQIGNNVHETVRNFELIKPWMSGGQPARPGLYPQFISSGAAEQIQPESKPFVVLAPASQWFTKQWPSSHWVELINHFASKMENTSLYLVGGKADRSLLEQIKKQAEHPRLSIQTDGSLMETAALMLRAQAVVSNDSGPLHLASAVNAPTVALFCSTTPAFGFGPLAEKSEVVEADEPPPCKPCGLHGHRKCPAAGEHFLCGNGLAVEKVWLAIVRVTENG